MIDFFEFSNEMLCIADDRGYFTRVNPAWTRTLGWSAEELTTRPYVEFVHPDDVAATYEEAARLTTNEHETIRFENRYRCVDGSYKWIAWRVVTDAASGQWFCTARDVTEQKQQTEALREAEELFRTVALQAPVGIARADAEGRVFFVNQRWCALAGTSAEENYAFGWMDHVHADDLPRLLEVWRAAMQAGRDMPRHEFRFVHKQGGVHWASASVAMLTKDGRVVGQIATVEDVTLRKEAEQALRESENRFRHLITHAHVGIVQTDAQGSVIFVNRKWCDLAGVTADRAVGEGWRAVIHPDDVEELARGWEAAVREARDYAGEVRFVRPSGEIVWISYATSALCDEAGRALTYIGTVVDVTEQRRAREVLEAEQDLLRQSIELKDHELKLIAYDIHDGLVQYAIGAGLHLDAYRARHPHLPEPEKLLPAVTALQATIVEGRRLINGIRTPVLDRHGLVAALEELVREKTTAATEIEYCPPPADFGRLSGDYETALYRMSQEALTNAVKHSGSPHVRLTLERDERAVRLRVQDWGVGINGPSSSRGVHGLSGIKERTRLLKGRCRIESTPGCGTTIEIELPLVGGQPAANASQ